MELWIRSQDKFDLVPINNPISILKDEWFEGFEKQYQKYNLTYNDKKLGVYNSLEKALEVLDEIQQTIKQQEFVKLTFSKIPPEQYDKNEEKIDKLFSYFVYEMPKE